MTEYTILVVTDAGSPVTYEEAGTVEAKSKDKAVRKFKEAKSLGELEKQFTFNGFGNIVDVLAVPNRYVSQYALNYGGGSAEVTEITKTEVELDYPE